MPSPISRQISNAPSLPKSAGSHSADHQQHAAQRQDALSTPASNSSHRACSTQRPAPPARIPPSAAPAISATPRIGATTASSAIGPTIIRPRIKPPCRLAHSAISGSSQNDGAARRSAASISPPTHAIITGSASTCGRASRCAVGQRQRRCDKHQSRAVAQMPAQEFCQQREGHARFAPRPAPPARSSLTVRIGLGVEHLRPPSASKSRAAPRMVRE